MNMIKLENISMCCENKCSALDMPNKLTDLDLDPQRWWCLKCFEPGLFSTEVFFFFFFYTIKSSVFWELTPGHFLHNSPLFASALFTLLLSWGSQGAFPVNHLAAWGISIVSRGRTQGYLPTSSTTQAFKGEGMTTHSWFSQIQFEPFFFSFEESKHSKVLSIVNLKK